MLAARRGKDVARMHLYALRDRFVGRRVAGVERDYEIDAFGIVRADVGLEEQDAIRDIEFLRQAFIQWVLKLSEKKKPTASNDDGEKQSIHP